MSGSALTGGALINKKGEFQFWSAWVELFFVFILIIGIIIGMISPSATITYFVALAVGMVGGRMLYERKGKERAQYILLVIAFIMGYVLGTWRGDRIITLLLFLFGAGLIYFLLNKHILKDTWF